MYLQFDNFPIEFNFRLGLIEMRNLLDFPNELIRFLFSSLQIKTRFSVLKEMCEIFGKFYYFILKMCTSKLIFY